MFCILQIVIFVFVKQKHQVKFSYSGFARIAWHFATQNAYRHKKSDFCTFRFAKRKQKFRVQIRPKKKRFD